MSNLKVGDSFLYKNELWEISDVLPGSYETKLIRGPSTVWLWWPKNTLHNHLLALEKHPPLHTHTLKLYRGFTDTYNYCIECNHKEKA